MDCETLFKTVKDAKKEVNELNSKIQDLVVVHENDNDSETFLKTVTDAETEVNELNSKIQDLVYVKMKLILKPF